MNMKSEIDYALNGILDNDSFLGVAICSRQGKMLSCHMPEFYDCDMLQETVYTMVNAFPTIRELGFNVELTDFTFDQMRLMVKETAESYTFMLVEPHAKASIVNAAIQVTEKRLANILQAKSDDFTGYSNSNPADSQNDEIQALKRELEDKSVIIFGDETTHGRSLQRLLDDEAVIFFNNRAK